MDSKDYVTFGGLLITATLGIWNLRHNLKLAGEQQSIRDQSKKGDERRYGALLAILATETVGLFERMVQYSVQAREPSISLSRPFVLLGSDQLVELVKLGAPSAVMRAVIQVRAVNDLVTRSVDRAHDIMAGNPEAASYEESDRAIFSAAALGAKQHFNSASAFVKDEYKALVTNVQLILDTAATVTPSEALREDYKRFKTDCEKYDKLPA